MGRPDPGLPPSEEVWKREYITAQEAAGQTGIAANSWDAWCAAGHIPGAMQHGDIWLIPRDEVEKRRASQPR